METIDRSLLTFLLNALWQIPLVALIAMLAGRALRTGPAAYRHGVWVAALAAAIALPLMSIKPAPASSGSSPLWLSPDVVQTNAGAVPAAAPAALRSAPAAAGRSISFARTTTVIVVFAYLLFVVFRFTRLAVACVRTVRIRRSARRGVPSAVLESVWSRVSNTFGIEGVELLVSDGVAGPLMTGLLRKAIVVPQPLWSEQSEAVLTSAIGHEMAHIARRDFALNVLYQLLYLPVSFHPAAAAILREIERTRELACDELVARRLMDAHIYARSIMSIASAMAGAARVPQQGYTLGVFDGDILEERIKRLVNLPVAGIKRGRLLLATGLGALAVYAVVASGLAITARAQSTGSAEMKLAGEAYNNGDFQSAVQHFENAVSSDAANTGAKLFLANALLREFFAEKGDTSSPLLARARQQYQNVLAVDPRNKLALAGMITVAMDSKQMPDAREWALKLMHVDPIDKTGSYTVAVTDWAAVYPEFVRAKDAAGVRREEYFIPDAQVRARLRDQFGARVEDGVAMLKQALLLDPTDSSAMAYMNLLDRLKAGMADNSGEAQTWIAEADGWVKRALDARHSAASAPGSDRPLNVEGPPPGPAGPGSLSAFPPAPPPPPPPPPPPSPKDV